MFNIKTRGRLLISFALILTGTIGTLLFTSGNLKRVENVNSQVFELDSLAYELTFLRADINNLRAVSLTLLAENDSRIVQQTMVSIGLLEKEILDKCHEIDMSLSQLPQLRNQFKDLNDEIISYITARVQYLNIVKAGNLNNAYDFVVGTLNPYYESVNTKIVSLENHVQTRRREMLITSDTLRKKVASRAILFGFILMLLVFVISVFVIRMLKKISGEIKNGIEILATSSQEILTTITEMSTGASETAAAVSETTATIEEVRQTATIANQKAKSLLDSSNRVKESAEKGQNSLNEVINGMGEIDKQMKKISTTVIKLSEQNRRIGEITSTVSDIADQSNLLAVNAAIEAAKAGEHGRGFTIVAQEIRNLSDQSKRATQQVKEILNEIDKSVNNTVGVTEDAMNTVESGKLLVTQSNDIIDILAHNIEEASDVTMQLSSSNHQQMAGMDQIVPAMENIKKASEQNATGIQQAQSATKEIHNLGQSLKKILLQFNL